MKMMLHDFYRSSASFRVRIALNLKGVDYTSVVQDLDRGAHRAPAYLEINRQALLPALQTDEGVLTQSGAILEYLDARFPDPPLLPVAQRDRARVRALFQIVACDTHPLTAMRVARYLKQTVGCDDALVLEWKRHWMLESLGVLERELASDPATGSCCHGERPTLADVALVPQVVSARTAGVALDAFPTISRIYENCMRLTAFREAHPDACSSQPALN